MRCRSLPNVLEELRRAKQLGETTISFVDEYFVRPYDELCAFFERYAEEIDLPFTPTSVEDSGKRSLNGLAICHPEAVLPGGEVLPIVIFSAHAAQIYRTIPRRWPQFTDVVSCAML